MKAVGARSPWWIALALSTLLASGCESPEARLQTHLANALELREAGKQPEALLELRSALRLDPNNAEVNYRIAQTLQVMRRNQDALFFLREARRLDPHHSEATLELAWLLLRELPDEAEELIAEVLEREPENPRAHVRRSELALARSEMDEALGAALTAMELAPDDPSPHLAVGSVRKAEIQLASRMSQLTNPAPVAPTYEQALESFDRAIELAGEQAHPDGAVLTRALMERAEVLASWFERRGEAPAAYQLAVERAAPWPDLEADALSAAYRYAAAIDDVELKRWIVERRVERQPGNIGTWAQLARVAERADGSGLEVLRALLEERPDDPRAHVLYAQYLSLWQGPAEAIEHLRAAIDRGVEAPELWSELVDRLLSAGDLETARQALARLQREYPDSPGAQLAGAQIALLEGRLEEAAAVLRVLATKVESMQVERLLTEAELRLGNHEAALAAIDRAKVLAGSPLPAALLRLDARARLLSGDWQGVVRSLNILALRPGGLTPGESVMRVRALYRSRQPEQARRELEGLLARPEPPPDAVLLYVAREGRANPTRAGILLEAALRSAPGDERLVRSAALFYLRQGDGERALERLDAALAAHPDAPRLLMVRARVRRVTGDAAGALEDARRSFELAPGQEGVADLMIRLFEASGGLDEGVALLEGRLQAGSLSPSGRLLLARLYDRTEQSDRALELLEGVLAEQPDLPSAKNDLAYVLAKRGERLDQAYELAAEARQALPNAPAVADTLGLVLLRRGLAGPAQDQFLAAIRSVGERGDGEVPPTYRYHLGLALKELGRGDEARAAFEAALSSSDPFPEAVEARHELEALQQT